MITSAREEQLQAQLQGAQISHYLRLETVLLIEDSEELNKSLSLRFDRAGQCSDHHRDRHV